MKVALAQLNYHIGNFESNTSKILKAIEKARAESADLVVFAELAISGYPPRDFLEFDDFIRRCMRQLEIVSSYCIDIAAIIGGPSRNRNFRGKRLYNSAYFLHEGKIKDIYHKSLLPTYDVFDEYRYFEPHDEPHVVSFNGERIALTICEDLWDTGDMPLYVHSPMEKLIEQSPDLIINIAASPYHLGQQQTREEVLTTNAKKYKLPLLYVNHVGAQTELLFDGNSMAINAKGEAVDMLLSFEEDFRIVDTDTLKEGGVSTAVEHKDRDAMGELEAALVMGIRNYFSKLGFKKAILGLSGGIDSALTLVLAVEALGADNVLSVLLPSRFSSDHSVNDARQLAENLGSPYKLISIESAFKEFESILKPHFEGREFGLAEENIQARSRALILMALSNKFSYILLNTSNKSEAAVGYGTLYGDMCGGLSVLGDVYKSDVFKMSKYINRNKEIIPDNIITKPPSAELRPDQKDSDSLPDYEILDKILFQYIEKLKGPNELIDMGFDPEVVKKTLRLVNTNEYKRHQTPPILRVSSRAFGMGRRMPIVARYLS